jgi:hypothetical protein
MVSETADLGVGVHWGLAELDRGLIRKLLWDGRGEDDLARELGGQPPGRQPAETEKSGPVAAGGGDAVSPATGKSPRFYPPEGCRFHRARVLISECA